jgi:hypothetical protein
MKRRVGVRAPSVVNDGKFPSGSELVAARVQRSPPRPVANFRAQDGNTLRDGAGRVFLQDGFCDSKL